MAGDLYGGLWARLSDAQRAEAAKKIEEDDQARSAARGGAQSNARRRAIMAEVGGISQFGGLATAQGVQRTRQEGVSYNKTMLSTGQTTAPEEVPILGELDGQVKVNAQGGDTSTGHLGTTGTSTAPLGQNTPLASTETTLYTCPASTKAVVKHIIVSNGGNATTFSLGIAVGGGSMANEDHFFQNTPIQKGQTAMIEGPFYMSPTDVIRTTSGNGSVNFSAWGTTWA